MLGVPASKKNSHVIKEKIQVSKRKNGGETVIASGLVSGEGKYKFKTCTALKVILGDTMVGDIRGTTRVRW